MTRHSKNCTAGAFFTSSERERLAYGTKRQRLGRDSRRRVDACCICLSPSVAPVVCGEGHLFCRECILKALLGQRERAAAAARRDRRRAEEGRAAAEAGRLASEAAQVAAFERQSSGRMAGPCDAQQAREELQPAEAQPADGARPAPTHCPMDGKPLALRGLTSVRWAAGEPTCTSCSTAFASALSVVIFAQCGHAACCKCVDRFLGDGRAVACFTCGGGGGVATTDLIRIRCSSTGFAGGSTECQVAKYDHAFI